MQYADDTKCEYRFDIPDVSYQFPERYIIQRYITERPEKQRLIHCCTLLVIDFCFLNALRVISGWYM